MAATDTELLRYLRTYCHLFTLASGLHIIKNESLKKFFHKILDEIQN